MIEKDLLRLQHMHHTCHHQRISFRCPEQEVSFDIAVAERTEILTQMLQVYAKQHAHVGYRQGMHELISYCLTILYTRGYQLTPVTRPLYQIPWRNTRNSGQPPLLLNKKVANGEPRSKIINVTTLHLCFYTIL
jgi:hypothetical protein